MVAAIDWSLQSVLLLGQCQCNDGGIQGRVA